MQELAVEESLGPVPSTERITVIDCLRGAALFGILAANMRGFNSPAAAYFQPSLMWTETADRISQALVDWLISGKFITIFATLFGIGFAIQMERAVAHGRGLGFFARRMVVLILIGVAHAFGVWWGDILISYGVCGLLLMLFRNSSQKWTMRWGQFMYWFLVLLFGGFFIAMMFGAPPPPPPPTPNLAEQIGIYSQGTIGEIFRQRAADWLMLNSFFLFLTRILGLFLFGTYIWRQGYLRNPSDHLGWWKNAQVIGGPIGLIGNFIFVALDWIYHPNPMAPSGLTYAMFVIQSAAIPALSLFYASTIVLLYQDPVWRVRLEPFSYVGRMALTNYLMQSVICTTIFYSYGLGLFGKVGPALNLIVTVVIYGLQIPFSKWWLATHRYGPMEWVWRRLTYGRLGTVSAGSQPA
jgi:uncharacterized protein